MSFIETLKYKFAELEKKLQRLNDDQKHSDLNQEARTLDEEKRFYDREHPIEPQEKVARESGGQDISAI